MKKVAAQHAIKLRPSIFEFEIVLSDVGSGKVDDVSSRYILDVGPFSLDHDHTRLAKAQAVVFQGRRVGSTIGVCGELTPSGIGYSVTSPVRGSSMPR